MHSGYLISVFIDRARWSPEGIVRCVVLRLVLLLEMARSRVVPVGWELEAGWVTALGFLTSMFLCVIDFLSLFPAGWMALLTMLYVWRLGRL